MSTTLKGCVYRFDQDFFEWIVSTTKVATCMPCTAVFAFQVANYGFQYLIGPATATPLEFSQALNGSAPQMFSMIDKIEICR